MAKFDTLLEEATSNIRIDRESANAALEELVQDIHQGKTTHHQSGAVMAKYLETLQRSNEQLVKIASLLSKKDKHGETLSSVDIDHIYDNLGENTENG
jgi:septal ring factor EnvC (AmiA/AmiB activator)